MISDVISQCAEATCSAAPHGARPPQLAVLWFVVKAHFRDFIGFAVFILPYRSNPLA
jgi:hypothetical protein